MALFFTLFIKLIPLYLLILLGFLSSKYLKVDARSISTLAIYTISPAVIFYGVAKTPIDASTISLPVIFFSLCSIVSVLFYSIGKRLWSDTTPHILAYACGTANNG